MLKSDWSNAYYWHYGITSGVEFHYNKRHSLRLSAAYDDFNSLYWSVKYQFTRVNPPLSTDLLPFPRYHVEPPIARVVSVSPFMENYRVRERIFHEPPQKAHNSQNQLKQALNAEITSYVARLDPTVSPRCAMKH